MGFALHDLHGNTSVDHQMAMTMGLPTVFVSKEGSSNLLIGHTQSNPSLYQHQYDDLPSGMAGT